MAVSAMNENNRKVIALGEWVRCDIKHNSFALKVR